MQDTPLDRRSFLGAGAALAVSAGSTASSSTEAAKDSVFEYEVVRSDAEWRERLTIEEYEILRNGGTEAKKSSAYWDHEAEGSYCCKGCGLTLYDSTWQVYPGIGWVFFRQSRPNTILMDIDGNPYTGMADTRILSIIEVHCRRCGSHLGHLLTVNNATLHCVNGKALEFRPAA